MVQLVSCPERDELLQSLVGLLPSEHNEAIAEHLESCPRCLNTAANSFIHDQLFDSLRSSDARLELTVEDQHRLQQVISWIRISPSVCTQSNHETLVNDDEKVVAGGILIPGSHVQTEPIYQFLAPPQKHGDLGSLGKYRILKVLGLGGMGIVFEALDPDLNRRVALKVMKPQWGQDGMASKRYLREARLAASIEHDHIIAIYEVNSEHAVPFLVMQLLKGQSLQERLDRERCLPLKECLRIGREIAEALAAAHARNLIHRDIKPENIWLEQEQGRVKLLDFGLARPIVDDVQLTHSGTLVGTPAYMSPEQAGGLPADARADLFSLGVVMYKMTTGRPPFPGNHTLEILRSLLLVKPPAPNTVDAAIPRELSRLIEQLLAKNPDDRPAQASDVVQRLIRLATMPTVDPTMRLAGGGNWMNILSYITGRAGRRKAPGSSETQPWTLIARCTRWLAVAGALAVLLAIIIVRFKTKDGKETEISLTVPGEVQSVTTDIREDGSAPKSVSAATQPVIQQPVTQAPAIHPPVISTPIAVTPPNSVKTSPALNLSALVRTPAQLAGVASWTLETIQHRAPVTTMAYSPNSKLLATLDVIGQIRIWDAATGALSRVLIGDEFIQNGPLGWSPDSERIVRGCGHTVGNVGLTIWHIHSGKVERRIETNSYITDCGFLPDGKSVYSFEMDRNHSQKSFNTWDVAAGKQIEHFNTVDTGGAVSTDGKLMAVMSLHDSKVQAYDFGSWQLKWESVIPETGPQPVQQFRKLAWSPDGKTLAVGPGAVSGIALLDGATGQLKFHVAEGVRSQRIPIPVAWTHDSLKLVIGLSPASAEKENEALQVFDVNAQKFIETGNEKLASEAPRVMSAIALSPDGQWLANTDSLTSSVNFSSAVTGERQRQMCGHCSSRGAGLQWLNDGNSLAIGYYDLQGPCRAAVWDTASGMLKQTHNAGKQYQLSSPDRARFLSHSETAFVMVRDEDAQQILIDFPHSDAGRGQVAWSADGNVIATGAAQGSSKLIKVWDANTGDFKIGIKNPLRRHGGPLALSFKGSLLATGESQREERQLLLFDTSSGATRQILALKDESTDALAFAPDEMELAMGATKWPENWRRDETTSGWVQIITLSQREIGEVTRPLTTRLEFHAHRTSITAIAWSRDGRMLATTSGIWGGSSGKSDGGIRLWSAKTGEPRGELL
ncbi:MAG: hypothetical protein JWM11_1071, partial [Planctomycetaceae bacterium]|nr:hypothetical protein [Planctomycetaceae bacterium]